MMDFIVEKKTEKSEEYYLVDIESSKEYLVFWGPDGKGYTKDITKAGLYNAKYREGSYKVFDEPKVGMWKEQHILIPTDCIEKFGNRMTVIWR